MANTINSEWHPRARKIARRRLAAALVNTARNHGAALPMYSTEAEICWTVGRQEYRIERSEFARAMRDGVARIVKADKAAGVALVTAGDNALDVDCRRPLGTTATLVEAGRIPSPPWREL